MTSRDPLRIWAISDGRTGMENQALGLAEAIARAAPAKIVLKRIAISAPYGHLPRALWGPDPLSRLSAKSDTLAPPYPDIAIGCGRRTVPLSMALTKKGVFTVQTQDPRAPLDAFSLVIPPHHDGLEGENVVSIVGSPNRLTEARLREEATQLLRALPPLPRPFVTVLIGGPSKHYRFTEAALSGLIDRLREAMAAGYGLLITDSRRTPLSVIPTLEKALGKGPYWIWRGQTIGGLSNPYFGMLGLADRVMVTAESANMLTEAAFTGQPVDLIPLEGGAPKWRAFHKSLEDAGALRSGARVTEEWSYPPLRETDRVAQAVLDRVGR